jgi:hypothetical protein
VGRLLTIAEPVEGWRGWRLAVDRGRPVLIPLGRGKAWPGRRPLVAQCWRRRRHHAPVVACTCGIYAVPDRAQLRHARSPAVVGPVALWGRVVVHTSGWRAELGYPQRLGLICAVCGIARTPADSRPDIVAACRDGSLIPLCARHLRLAHVCGSYGRFDTLSVETTLAALADDYAVEPIDVR